MKPELKPGERLDDLQLNGLMIIQNPKAFCYGTDAVLLSDFAKAAPGRKVLDIGTGTGIVPLLMSAKNPGSTYTALEIQESMAEMAARSVAYNGLEERIRIVNMDVREARGHFPRGSFDVITSNPPYIRDGGGIKGANETKLIARHEITLSLRELCEAAKYLLNDKCSFFMVHRATRVAEIIEELHLAGLEPKRLRFVHPFIDAEPQQVLIEAVNGGAKETRVLPPLIEYEAPGIYSAEINRIYGITR